jgi:hypothetical protein
MRSLLPLWRPLARKPGSRRGGGPGSTPIERLADIALERAAIFCRRCKRGQTAYPSDQPQR